MVLLLLRRVLRMARPGWRLRAIVILFLYYVIFTRHLDVIMYKRKALPRSTNEQFGWPPTQRNSTSKIRR